jgi:hypothetical protein
MINSKLIKEKISRMLHKQMFFSRYLSIILSIFLILLKYKNKKISVKLKKLFVLC